MIRYNLRCGRSHAFEAWFAGSEAYEAQRAAGVVECPICGDRAVEKAIMAPAVATGGGEATLDDAVAMRRLMRERMKALRAHIESTTEDVGSRFADEARLMHRGEIEDRAIRGQATGEEVRELLEEGAPVAPVPWIEDEREN